MNLRRIKHSLLRLSAEEKVIGAGGILVLIGSFMPWHSVIMSFDKQNITQNAFSGDLGVIGFVIFLMVLMAMLILLGDNLHIRMPQLGYTKEQTLFFLMGQSAFLILLTMIIYTKRSFEFTNAELRFGVLIALLGAFFGTFAAFSQTQKIKEKKDQAFFGYNVDDDEGESEKDSEAEVPEARQEEDEMTDRESTEELEEIVEDIAEEIPEKLFYEISEKPKQEEDESLNADFDIDEGQIMPTDDVVEEVEIVEKIEITEPPSKENKVGGGIDAEQRNFFTREAGIKKENNS